MFPDNLERGDVITACAECTASLCLPEHCKLMTPFGIHTGRKVPNPSMWFSFSHFHLIKCTGPCAFDFNFLRIAHAEII